LSHLRERVEKNCLNCNAQVAGRFCQICGQENIEVVETTWHLITHFFNDFTHFDGKFFSTLRYLAFKPGFVSSEYMYGRRGSYLNPIRMYLFTSAIFFFIFFSVFNIDENLNAKTKFNNEGISAIEKMDSTTFASYSSSFNNGIPMTRETFKRQNLSEDDSTGISFSGSDYKSKKEYDSVLALGVKKHNWLTRTLIYRQIEINEKYKKDQGKILNTFLNILVHSFPQMLFLSLPLFALILQLLYIRRKQYYYTNHLIFSIHLYIFIFIVLLTIIGLTQLKTYLHWSLINWIIGFLFVFLFYYEYRSMRNFYQQGRGKTILKYLILNFLHLVIISILFIIFIFFSLLKV